MFSSFQSGEVGKKKKKKKNKGSDSKLFSNAGGPFQGENTANQENGQYQCDNVSRLVENQSTSVGNQSAFTRNQSSSFGSLFVDGSIKQRSNSLGTNDTMSWESKPVEGARDAKGTKGVSKGLARKPPVSQGTKVSPKLSAKMNKISSESGSKRAGCPNDFEEGKFQKGHRRQQSLPKQHYSSIESVRFENPEIHPISALDNDWLYYKGGGASAKAIFGRNDRTLSCGMANGYDTDVVNGREFSYEENFDQKYPLEKSYSDTLCSTEMNSYHGYDPGELAMYKSRTFGPAVTCTNHPPLLHQPQVCMNGRNSCSDGSEVFPMVTGKVNRTSQACVCHQDVDTLDKSNSSWRKMFGMLK